MISLQVPARSELGLGPCTPSKPRILWLQQACDERNLMHLLDGLGFRGLQCGHTRLGDTSCCYELQLWFACLRLNLLRSLGLKHVVFHG